MDAIAVRLGSIHERIDRAAAMAGRPTADITLIVVTKFHPPELVEALAQHGVTDVGENRHQEASEKQDSLAHLDLRWHFIGQLQSNKARSVAQYASSVHSLDSVKNVRALNAAILNHDDGDPMEVFLQVNLTENENRGGVATHEIEAVTDLIAEQRGLRMMGVMGVAPLGADPRTAFARLRTFSERVQLIVPEADRISAGMSHDFEAAISEGATHLRIGTAITGNRPDSR